MGLEECFLDGIVGVGLRTHEVRGPQSDVLIATHELLVRRDVTTAGARDRFGVFRRTALHGSTVPPTPAGAGGFPRGRTASKS